MTRSSRTRRMAVGFAVVAVAASALFATTPSYALSSPSFTVFPAPLPLGRLAGEPSIGVNWATGNVMVQALLQTLRVSNFNAAAGTATWTDVTPLLTSRESFDPILFTDSKTGRTFVSQLTAACSLMAFTDDDGASWTQNPAGCGAGTLFDHQTVGGGKFAGSGHPLGSVAASVYPNAVYYCAQVLVGEQCAVSLNGGLTFGAGVPIYGAAGCIGGTGHLRVGPDGTAYVPIGDCGFPGASRFGLAASSDNGTRWSQHLLPGTTPAFESDPSVAADAAGKLYYCYQDASGSVESRARVKTSTNKGAAWSPSGTGPDIGSAFGLRHVQFPAVIAGDSGRAACAFLGSTTSGNDQSASFAGTWDLYVSTTFDGGATWSTAKVTSDPVQRGRICMAGINCNGGRNLLDFFDITVDKQGRILVVFADGCTGPCVTGSGASNTSHAVVVRQSGGSGLFAAYDPAPGP